MSSLLALKWHYSALRSVQMIAEVAGLVSGYPCTSISGQNPEPKSFTDKNSSTGCGYHSTMKYVSSSPELQWVLLENVQRMFHTRSKFKNEVPMEIQNREMEKRGFQTCFSLLLNSCEFGLAQSRSRAWVLYIRSTNVKLLDDINSQF